MCGHIMPLERRVFMRRLRLRLRHVAVGQVFESKDDQIVIKCLLCMYLIVNFHSSASAAPVAVL